MRFVVGEAVSSPKSNSSDKDQENPASIFPAIQNSLGKPVFLTPQGHSALQEMLLSSFGYSEKREVRL